MRPYRAVNRLLRCAPPLLAQLPLPPHDCILATRVAIDVLARFGIEAQPRSVLCAVANEAYAQWRYRVISARAARLPEAPPPPAAWCVWAGLPDYAPPAGQWPGHLIAFLPGEGDLVDLDFRAFARPDKALDVPPSVVAHWPAEDAAITYTARDLRGRPFYVRYERQDANVGYRAADVWRRDHPDTVAIVGALERAMRVDG
jgi:hypothetical protein